MAEEGVGVATAEGSGTVPAPASAEPSKEIAEKPQPTGVKRSEIETTVGPQVLDTPRTREACRRLGLVLEDLHFRPYESFAIPGDLKDKQQLRFNHYEKRRKDRLGLVLTERAKVIAQNHRKGEVPGVQSAQFLSMLENLFDKETKRLETDLKGQLRQHTILVKDNTDQLMKEEQLERQNEKRLARRQAAKLHADDVSRRTRQNLEDRFSKAKEHLDKQEKDFEERQANHAKGLVAEEERMQRFAIQKAAMNSEKMDVYRSKVEHMKEKTKNMHVERRLEGEKQLLEIEKRISDVTARREEEQKNRMMRSEEQHLHIMDVRAHRDRIDRMEGFRRDELNDQIQGNVERIETLMALKDQLLDQRKARAAKQEATRSSRGLNLRRDCLPGPGSYEAAPSCMNELPTTKFGNDRLPGFVDEATKAGKFGPAPGSYATTALPNGDRLDRAEPSAVQFGHNKRESFLDDAMRAKEDIPAPGRYESKPMFDHRGTKLKREVIQDQGLDKHSVKRYPTWQRPGTETPGPAMYSVDEYHRKEVLRRAQRSLPNLTKDMLRPAKVAG